jgi:hypothetical protein
MLLHLEMVSKVFFLFFFCFKIPPWINHEENISIFF